MDTEQDYDVEEMSILQRFKHFLANKGWDAEDFDGMSFLDIEDAYFYEGGVEFR